MTPLVIVGAGDHGRGTLEIVRAANAAEMRYEVVGYLDDRYRKGPASVGGVPIVGDLEWPDSHHRAGLSYVIAVADCQTKNTLAAKLQRFTPDYASIVHPTASIASGVRIGAGAIVGAGVVIAYDTSIEEHVTLNLNCTVGHDCIIGRFTTVAPGANIAGRVRIGEGCDVGLNAAVGKGLTVGEWSTVGPGAVIVKDVQRLQRLFGNPARVIPSTGTER